jgi:hypothetical protein
MSGRPFLGPSQRDVPAILGRRPPQEPMAQRIKYTMTPARRRGQYRWTGGRVRCASTRFGYAQPGRGAPGA